MTRKRRIILDAKPGSFDVVVGDATEALRAMPANSVHCCVTSPPYFGLRDYGVDKQMGLEASPGRYVEAMVALFEEVRRVLRPDGTLWLNLGDSYCGPAGGNQGKAGYRAERRHTAKVPAKHGAKHKDLLGIPWMVAFALRAAGWWLRQDIIWAKPNPMPESVTDRCTKSHEYIFLLTKRAKYYYDHESVREQPKLTNDGTIRAPKMGPDRPQDSRQMNEVAYDEIKGANKRSVWTVSTKPFAGAHFATFSEELIAPCILAGTSARGCCSKCGAPHRRVIEKGDADIEHQRACGGDAAGNYAGKSTKDYAKHKAQDASATKARILAGMRKKKTKAWEPTCTCEGATTVQCVVLDPFTGSGTTGIVARKYGRRFIGSELNPEYAAMARRRIGRTPRPLIAAGV